jgi:hypothetical protein
VSHTPGPCEDERHPLDGALGDIHEIALALAAAADYRTAHRLAVSHEAIQQYLIAQPELIEALKQAEAFIADELEHREDSFPPTPTDEEQDYIGEARTVLESVRSAIARAEGVPASGGAR